MTAAIDTLYHSGFGNEFASEALPGALPAGQNSPQQVPYGLYAEQLSGTAFTAPRHANRRSWLYRIRPAAMHAPFRLLDAGRFHNRFDETPASPNPLRWDPLPLPAVPTDFVEGLFTLAGNGGPEAQSGVGIHLYACNRSMQGRYFYNADAELLIVPQQGGLRLATELGMLDVAPLEIAVIPRGVRFRVELTGAAQGGASVAGAGSAGATAAQGGASVAVGSALPAVAGSAGATAARGYVVENFGAHLRLPELGPIGANALANARDFLAPVAAYEDAAGDFELLAKFQGRLWSARIDHSPLDVVAWHGNDAPYKYDLARFNTIGSISYDHPDPSIFTVLTAPSDTPGTANIDFAIFPPRWLVAEHTFRPPWFHRNVASEFMGLITGEYDAKTAGDGARGGGFAPGGASLHNCMSGHGPDAASYARAVALDTARPQHLTDTMAFMFETRAVIRPTAQALALPELQADYWRCWQGLPKHFDPARREK